MVSRLQPSSRSVPARISSRSVSRMWQNTVAGSEVAGDSGAPVSCAIAAPAVDASAGAVRCFATRGRGWRVRSGDGVRASHRRCARLASARHRGGRRRPGAWRPSRWLERGRSDRITLGKLDALDEAFDGGVQRAVQHEGRQAEVRQRRPRQSLALAEMFTAGGDEDIGGVSSGGGRALKHTRAAGRRQMAPPPTAPSRAYCFRFSLGISVLTAWFCRSMSAMKAGVSA